MSIKRFITGSLDVNTYCFSLSENTLCVIDPGGNVETLMNYAKNLNKIISTIILTHGHLDHVAGTSLLKKLIPPVHIYIHSGDKHYLGKEGLATHSQHFARIGMDSLINQHELALPEADFFLENEEILFTNSDFFPSGLQVLYTPGHTIGSVSFYSKERNCLFSGDTLFKGTHGRTDLPTGSHRTMRKTLHTLFALPEQTLVYPGHGEYTIIADEKNMRI
ncbi:MAG: MBL fold metallo-hydrolase [Treponemataceae bacterium]